MYHTVTFNVDGDTALVLAAQVRDGLTATRPADPVQAGYYFHGWYTTGAFTALFGFATPVTAPMTLYGRWSATPPVYHTVTFDVDGDTALVPAAQVRDGYTATRPADPAQTGYYFYGWYTTGAFTALFDFATQVTAPMTLYGRWSAMYHTVTFDVDGDTALVPAAQVRDGLAATRPADPAQAGYYFYGWYTTGAFTVLFDFATPVTAPMTLYGRWSAIMHTVSFDTAGGSPISNTQVRDGYTVAQPADPTLVAIGFAPSTVGLWRGNANTGFFYTFAGWQHEGTAWNFASGTVTADITLTAVWTDPSRVPVVDDNDVAAAVAYVNANPGVFTLLIDGNATVSATQYLNVAGANLTIIGLGGEREISRTGGGGTHFTIGAAGQAGISFTIGDNITLQGCTTNNVVVVVQNGASFVMLDGSLITGQTNTGLTAALSGGGVRVVTGGTLIIDGGTISGNYTFASGGGVRMSDANSRLVMRSGTISGNRARDFLGGGGVHVQHAAAVFEMLGGTISGNAANGGPGGGVNANGFFRMSGGTIYGNEPAHGELANTANGAGAALNVVAAAATNNRVQLGTFNAAGAFVPHNPIVTLSTTGGTIEVVSGVRVLP
ncbi:MAG: InlB B-repeat-containing protein [Treponema sp.]|nr:InlB B-repeat-containing protein [Treponema sp.]